MDQIDLPLPTRSDRTVVLAMTTSEARCLGDVLAHFTPPATTRIRKWIYRGQRHAGWTLRSSLERATHNSVETMGLRNFARYGASYLRFHSGWGLVVEAQHYGLPTRLLDWTFSPAVALHFATRKVGDPVDVELLAIDWLELHRVQGLPLAAFTVDTLNIFLPLTLEGDGPLRMGATGDDHAVLVLEPPHLDARVTAQLSALTLPVSLTGSLEEVLQTIGAPELMTRIVIPSEYVRQVRFELDLLGIDEQRLTPGLTGVADRMKRTYTSGHYG